MSDNNTNQPNINLQDILKAVQTLQQQQPSAGTGWTQPAPSGPPPASPEKVLIPISLATPTGKLRVYLQFAGEVAATSQQLQQFLQNLLNSGLPLDIWQNSGQGGWNRGGQRRWN